MPLTMKNNRIEDQIETFLESVRKNGSTFGVTTSGLHLATDTTVHSTTFADGGCGGSPCRSESSSRITLASVSDESPTTTTTATDANSVAANLLDLHAGRPNGENQELEERDEATTFQDDQTMEDGSCPISVQDVAELLHKQHAILTGGKARDGCPIITFPDNSVFCGLADDDYQRLILYLTAVPSLHDADLGFVLVVDRRNDKWASVRAVLLKICGFFPGLVQTVYVLRPAGFLQKAISEVSNKFFKEEFKFKLVVCNSIEELHEYIDPRELTKDLHGCIVYDHKEWIEQRAAVENFSRHTRDISQNLHQLVTRLQETELPNDVSCTKEILRIQTKEFHGLKDDLRTMAANGEALLKLLRHPCTRSTPSAAAVVASCSSSMDPCPESKLVNVTAVERLLVQLEETERGFDQFWRKHEDRLQQCLELRRFEHEFRELQATLDANLKQLSAAVDLGDSVARVDVLLQETDDFHDNCKYDLEKAVQLCRIGRQLIESEHYAVDSIQPKCVELQRVCDDFDDLLRKRLCSLRRSSDLQERVERANAWCTRGVDLLAGQNLERCSSTKEFARVALRELDSFMRSSAECRLNDPKEFRNLFQDMITPETTALVQQVLRRIEDVQVMCEKKRASLQKLVEKPSRPVQPVNPEPAIPLSSSAGTPPPPPPSPQPQPAPQSNGSGNNATPAEFRNSKTSEEEELDDGFDMFAAAAAADNNQSEGTKKYARKARSLTKIRATASLARQEESETSLHNKQKHVTDELMDTERVYVVELRNILQGYKEEMKRPASRHLVPAHLLGSEDVLFGNMEDIYRFHNDVFLRDLENCVQTPELIGLCFIQRKESLHKLYTVYCQNKPKSEALRRDGGDNLPFFKECQKRLAHKLPLSAYLLKPVQRITKYQLLLKDLLKYSNGGRERQELQEAVECMLDVLRYVNDSMHQVAITGFTGCLSDLGRLLLQGSFNVWCERKSERLKELRLKAMQRHLFLYEKAVLFCKKVGKDELRSTTYCFKRCLKMSQVGLTESVSKGSKSAVESRKFELWTSGRTEVYVIQAPSLDVKDAWVKEVKSVLLEQFVHIKQQHHSIKIQKFASLNGVQPLHNDVATTQRYLRTTSGGGGIGGGAGNWDARKIAHVSLMNNKACSEEELSRRICMNHRRHVTDHDRPKRRFQAEEDSTRSPSSSSTTNVGRLLRPRSKSASSRPFDLQRQHPIGDRHVHADEFRRRSTFVCDDAQEQSFLRQLHQQRRRHLEEDVVVVELWSDDEEVLAANDTDTDEDDEDDEEEEDDDEDDEDNHSYNSDLDGDQEDGGSFDGRSVAKRHPSNGHRSAGHSLSGGGGGGGGGGSRLVALSDYDAVDVAEVTLREGDIVDVVKVGCAGWWFVSVVGTDQQGWAPASYMDRIKKRNSRSSLSTSSQDSVIGAGSSSTAAAASSASQDRT